MDSFKKSFKSHGSYKHHRKLSSSSSGGGANNNSSNSHEEQPILSDLHVNSDDDDHCNHCEVIVDIVNVTNTDNNKDLTSHANDNIWSEPSVEFWRDNSDNSNIIFPDYSNNGLYAGHVPRPNGSYGGISEDPSRLIGEFLQKQNASGGYCGFDIDLEMDEFRGEIRRPSTPIFGSPSVSNQTNQSKDLRVSFDQSVLASENNSADNDNPRRRLKRSSSLDNNNNTYNSSRNSCSSITNNSINHSASDDDEIHEDEVVKCTANASFNQRSTLLRLKTRSRLLDPPQELVGRSGRIPKSSQIRSGMLKGGNNEVFDDDDDSILFEEDVPEDFKKDRLDALTLLQWVSLVVIVAILVATLTIHPLKRKLLWNLQLWKWELMVLVLICGRLVSGWGIKLIVFFIERNFLLRKRVLYFVYGVRKAVQNCLWLGLVLIAWNALFNKKVERETKSKALWYVTKILVCLLIGTLLWLVKTLIIKVLASSFHVSTYFDRIQESVFSQYAIETLSGPPTIEIQMNEEEEEKIADELRTLQNAGATVPSEIKAAAFPSGKSMRLRSGRVIGSGGLQRTLALKNVRFSTSIKGGVDQGITIDHLHKLNTNNVSAWSMKRLVNIVRHGVLTTLDEQIVNSSNEDDSATMIRSENEAKAAARKIFFNVAKPGAKYIYLEDLMRFLREDEASKTMDQIDGAVESKRISKSCLKNWLVNVFRERRALALTLNDTKTAVNKLHQVVNVVVGIIILIIWLLVLGIATSKFLVFLSSQLLLVAFIFGNTCKTIFEAIIFLFVMHPFDVGDRCEVDGVQMIVEEMNILTTVFLRYDNQKVMYPNSTLATKSIGNFYRSPEMGDSVEFCIHISTPAEKIALMKQKIVSYIESKKDHWSPSPTIIVKDFIDLNQVKIALWVCHRMNHQNISEKWIRRALLLEEMVKIFHELGLQYRILPLDINVQSMPPITSNRLPPSWAGNASR